MNRNGQASRPTPFTRAARPEFSSPERRYSVEELYGKLTMDGVSFWTAIFPLYMKREITNADVRDLVRLALIETMGSYKLVNQLFNSPPECYKRLLNFLGKHNLQVDFRQFRKTSIFPIQKGGHHETRRQRARNHSA